MRDETVIIRKKRAQSYAYLFWLSGVRRGEHASLAPEGTTIGRDPDCEVVLDDDTVSAEQARIRQEDGQWFLYDLASANTTMVGDELPVYRHALSDRDRLTFGETQMMFRALPPGVR